MRTWVRSAALLAAATAAVPGHAADDARIQALEAQMQQLQTLLTETQAQLQELKETKADAATTPVIVRANEPAFGLQTPDGEFSFNLRGRVQADYGASFDQDDQFGGDGAEFRRLRLGVEGKAFGDFDYRLEVDFQDEGSVEVQDAFIGVTPKLFEDTSTRFRIGQFKTPNSLEEQTSSLFYTFFERAQFTDAFALDYELGAGANLKHGNYAFDAGVFFGNFDIDADDAGEVDEGLTLAGRGYYSGPAFAEDDTLHLGGSVRWREAGDGADLFDYDNDLPVQLGRDNLVETPDIGENDLFLGGEFAYGRGSFHTAVEGAVTFVNNDELADEPLFWGAGGEVAYWLTGEKHGVGGGTLANRPKVISPLFKGGFGAVQVGARADYIDLSDGALANGVPINGGESLGFAGVVNWWPNSHVKLSAIYAYNLLRNAEDAAALAGSSDDGENNIHTLGLRAQLDF